MTGENTVKNAVSGFFGRIDARLGKSWVGRNIFGVGAKEGLDTVTFLRNKHMQKQGHWFQKILSYLPKRAQSGLATGLENFWKFPGMGKLSGFVQANFLFDAVLRGYDVVKDSFTGFQKTEGGVLSRFIGGVKSGVKSLVKNVGAFAASVGAAVAVPLLLGVSITGPVGIIAGTIAGIVAGKGAHGILNKFIGTHSHTETPKDAGDPNQFFPGMEQNSIVQDIDKSWTTKDYLKPYNAAGNPWLVGEAPTF